MIPNNCTYCTNIINIFLQTNVNNVQKFNVCKFFSRQKRTLVTKFLTKLSGKKIASPLELRVQSFEIFGKTFGENNDVQSYQRRAVAYNFSNVRIGIMNLCSFVFTFAIIHTFLRLFCGTNTVEGETLCSVGFLVQCHQYIQLLYIVVINSINKD